jgi:hypothetical protein
MPWCLVGGRERITGRIGLVGDVIARQAPAGGG